MAIQYEVNISPRKYSFITPETINGVEV